MKIKFAHLFLSSTHKVMSQIISWFTKRFIAAYCFSYFFEDLSFQRDIEVNKLSCNLFFLQVLAATKRLNMRAEAGLISSIVMVTHLLPYLSDATLMDILQVSQFSFQLTLVFINSFFLFFIHLKLELLMPMLKKN